MIAKLSIRLFTCDSHTKSIGFTMIHIRQRNMMSQNSKHKEINRNWSGTGKNDNKMSSEIRKI